MMRAMMGKKKIAGIIPTYELYSKRGLDPELTVYINGNLYFSRHTYESESGVCPLLELKIGDVIRAEGFQYLSVDVDNEAYGGGMGYVFEVTVDRQYSALHFFVACTDPY